MLAVCAWPQTAPAAPQAASRKLDHPRPGGAAGAELRTARAFERARRQGSPALRAFFYPMPKGADLHSHLTGAIYAESLIRSAASSGLCLRLQALSFFKPPAMARDLPERPACGEGSVPASLALTDQHLYDALIDAFSMRAFVPTETESGHDHFFATFDRFSAAAHGHTAEWLDEAAARAAAQNEQYLELMHTPSLEPIVAASQTLGPVNMESDFAQLRQRALDGGLRASLPALRAEFDEAEDGRRSIEHCGEPQAAAGCRVELRYLYQVLRALPPPMVFAELLTGFELASADPLIVGINMVQPEDGRVAMEDYRLHMKMIDELHRIYPRVHIALHAGELSPGMAPPEGLLFHIRAAVEQGHAQRIGHGVDAMQESDPYGLLREMAARRVMVEINLTSNDVILNIKGADHPFEIYRQYHVPVALSTDDEGVSRIDLTHEYVRAALSYPLSYADFKDMVRTGLEHSFLPGESLWEQSGPFESFAHLREVCRAQADAGRAASGSCAAWLQSSEKARQQFELERRFHAFESAF
ncbi:MAG TPA: adenosine deaminase [Acidobacteriaceae bacterium]|nr:adenosine deaminase [Acidobacteriaceae bacterium]